MNPTTKKGSPVRIKGRYIASRSRRRSWCRLIRDARSTVSSRIFTGTPCNRSRVGADLRGARHVAILWVQVTRHERDSHRCDRHKLGKCRRLELQQVRRPMCLPITMIWLISCVMNSRNLADVSSEDERSELPRACLQVVGACDAEVRAGLRAGLE